MVGMALAGVAVALGLTGACVRSNGRPMGMRARVSEADPKPQTQTTTGRGADAWVHSIPRWQRSVSAASSSRWLHHPHAGAIPAAGTYYCKNWTVNESSRGEPMNQSIHPTDVYSRRVAAAVTASGVLVAARRRR